MKIALKARGVSFVDALMIAGQYQVKRDVPFIPGSAAAGVVVEIGPGVEGVAPGDRVLVPAGYADEAVVAASRVLPLPASVGFDRRLFQKPPSATVEEIVTELGLSPASWELEVSPPASIDDATAPSRELPGRLGYTLQELCVVPGGTFHFSRPPDPR